MIAYDYIIIGGGIAGVTAAETIREEDAGASITIISDEPHLLYSRPSLPAYLKNQIPREKLFLRTARDFIDRRIDLRLRQTVSFIDVKRKEITLQSREILSYRKLLIASGGHVRSWGKEEDKKYIYRLQTLDDADRIYNSLSAIKRPIIIGTSFIGLEFLEILVLQKTQPIVIMRDEHFFSDLFDSKGGALLQENFERYGIAIHPNEAIAETAVKDDILRVTTQSLREFQTDALWVGIGINRNIEFVQGSGVEVGERGVKVNEFLETNQENIFAAGDVAEYFDVILQKHRIVGNWTNAFLQGKRAGLNMIGKREPFRNVSAYSITNFGFQITALGDCQNELENIVRIDSVQKQYERFFFKNGVLAGVTMINCFKDKPHLTKLIANRVSLDRYRSGLKDFRFDINSIPA